MASIGDWIFLSIVLLIAGGIYWVVKGETVKRSLEVQKEGLKKHGISISKDGVSVKGSGRVLTQDEYVEKSQAKLARGLAKKNAFHHSHGQGKADDV